MNKIKMPLFSVAQIGILTLLFLSNMNAFQKCFYYIYAAFVATIIVRKGKILVDTSTLILCLFSFTYFFLAPGSKGNIMVALKQFAYPMCYIIGLGFPVSKNEQYGIVRKEEKNTIAIISVAALGSLAHFLLNMYINWGSLNRNNKDIWMGEIFGATGQAALAVLSIGLFSALLFSSKKKLIQIASGIGLSLIFIYNLTLAGRTIILLSLVAIMVAFVFDYKQKNGKHKHKKIFWPCVCAAAITIAYLYDFMGVRTLVLGSNLSLRFDNMQVTEDSRLIYKLQYLSLSLQYPLGGGVIRNLVGGYAHDLVLDAYNDVGLIGVFLLIVFLYKAIKLVVFSVKSADYSHEFKLVVLCVVIVLLLEFMVEPILAGMPWLFCDFCLIAGALRREVIYQEDNNEDFTN